MTPEHIVMSITALAAVTPMVGVVALVLKWRWR